MPMYVKVIDSKCCGYTVCNDRCPEVFKLDDQGLSYVDDQLVPEGLEARARVAVQSCPERALLMSETPFD